MTKVTQLSPDEEGGRRRIHLREISGDSETPLETVGQVLRAARLRRGDDLATVSRVLKIRKDHLEAVEEDRLGSLPGKTYAIGFVRSYAGYLGLDVVQVVERYKQEIAGRHDEHAPTLQPMPDEPRRLPQGWRIVAGVVVLAVGYGAWHLFSAGSAPQTVPPAPSLNPPRVAAVAPKPVTPPPAAPEQSATPSPATNSAADAPSATLPSTPAPVPAPPAGNSTSAQPASVSASATPSPAADAAPSPASPDSGTVYGRNNRNPRVVLKAKADTHIVVRDPSGMIYINRNLKVGDSYQLPNKVGLLLSTNNAGAVEVDLDGQAMGVTGSDSQSAADVPLDPQTIADRYSH